MFFVCFFVLLSQVLARMTQEPILTQMQGLVVSGISYPVALSLMVSVGFRVFAVCPTQGDRGSLAACGTRYRG